MKKSQIEKQLKSELLKNAPSDFSAVLSRCERLEGVKQEEKILVLEKGCQNVGASEKKGVASLALLLATILAFAFFLFPFIGGNGGFSLNKFAKGYFLFDVNPSVEVRYDQDGVVTQAEGLNEDGKTLLVGVKIEGLPYDEAAEKLMSRCVELGYFSGEREDNALLTTAIKESGEKDEKMTSALKKAMIKGFDKSNLRGVVITGVSTHTLVTEGKKYGVDGQKYGLIVEYLQLGGKLLEEEYATLSIRELYLKIEEKQAEKKAQSKLIYEQVFRQLEIKLNETIATQIGLLVSVLDSVLPIQKTETDRFAKLKSYAYTLKNITTQGERKILIEKVLAELDVIKREEMHAAHVKMIDYAKSAIIVTCDTLEKAFIQLEKVNATPEAISYFREKKFEGRKESSVNYDVKAWQKEKEGEISEKWFEMKAVWDEEREKEL